MLRKTVAVLLSLLLSVVFIVPYSAAETDEIASVAYSQAESDGTETTKLQNVNDTKDASIVGAPADDQQLGAATFSPRYDAPASNNPYYTSLNVFYKSGTRS